MSGTISLSGPQNVPVDSLFESNDQPSDAQRTSIEAKLRELKAEFQRVSGRPYARRLDYCRGEGALASEEIYHAIRGYEALLSSVRCIPPEILQQIFLFVAFSTSTTDGISDSVSHDAQNLFTACSVCRSWRTAAANHCRLWTTIPRICCGLSLGEKITSGGSELRELYLSRSGTLPLTVDISVTSDDWENRASIVTANLGFLHAQKRRLGQLTVFMPLEIFNELLSDLRGNLPLLRVLRINLETDTPASDPSPPTIDCFAEAPLLREVSFTGRSYSSHTGIELKVVLPWSQITSFNAKLDPCDIYTQVLQGQPIALERLQYYWLSPSFYIQDLPPSPCTLPNLTHLSFRQSPSCRIEIFTDRLDWLTLPALTHLQLLEQSARYDSDLAEGILSLVKRSACKLQDVSIAGAVLTSPAFTEFLSLSPSITTLEVWNIDGAFLRHLISPGSPGCGSDILPNLARLTLRVPEERRLEPGPRLKWIKGEVDFSSLMGMIISRTQPINVLERVTVYGCDFNVLKLDVARWEDAALGRSFGNTPSSIAEIDLLLPFAEGWENSLAGYLARVRDRLDGQESDDTEMYKDTIALLHELEELELGGINTSVFTVG